MGRPAELAREVVVVADRVIVERPVADVAAVGGLELFLFARGEAGRSRAVLDLLADYLEMALELLDEPAGRVLAHVVGPGVDAHLAVPPLGDEVPGRTSHVLGEGLRVLQVALLVRLRGYGDVHRLEVRVNREGRGHLLLDRREAELGFFGLGHPDRLRLVVAAEAPAVVLMDLHELGGAGRVEAAAAHLDGAVACRQLVADEAAQVFDEEIVAVV